MPGSRLSQEEKNLVRLWADARNFPHPLLASVTLRGGLRGINDCTVRFEQAVTVICGTNGSGKSTLLGLSALAFQGSSSFRARNGEYYTFRDFFFQGAGDQPIPGATVRWEYRGADAIEITKGPRKWMHYARRPPRPVDFVGIGRIVPPLERAGVDADFPARELPRSATELSPQFCSHLGSILGRTYDEARVLVGRRNRLRGCAQGGASYSSFNMGSGEDGLIELLSLLERMGPGGLVVVEELELGLHPEAQRRLASCLITVAYEKRLQVIGSSHSAALVDALPRACRVLIERRTGGIDVTTGPTTRYALSAFTGVAQEELLIFCEDHVASVVIEEALPAALRKRSRVVQVGNKDNVSRACEHEVASYPNHRWLAAFDGDTTDSELARYRARLPAGARLVRLPGGVPETALVRYAAEGTCVDQLAEGLRCDPGEMASILAQLAATQDPHDIPYLMSARLNIDFERALRALARAATNSPDFDAFRREVGAALGALVVMSTTA